MGPVTPRGIDQDVDAAERGLSSRDHLLHRRLVGDVAGHDHRAASEALDFARQLLERRHVARGQHEVRALAGERRADVPAHALGRSGHQRDPICEPHAT
jgi:hypothetical protein